MSIISLLKSDSYKFSHIGMFVPNTELVYSHLTPRTNMFLKQMYPDIPNTVITFGMQYVVRSIVEDWNETFFSKPWESILEEIYSLLGPHLSYQSTTELDNFKQLHELGYLPIHVKALPEGIEVPLNIPVLTIKNTHDDFFWFTNQLEPIIINQIYRPMTVATIGRMFAKLRNKYFDLTCEDNDPFRDFALHDFSFRGHSGWESAMMASMALSLYTKGTDTVVGLHGMKQYYDATETCYSLSATEHSVTSQGILWYANMATNFLAQEDLEDILAIYPEFKSISYLEELRTIVYTSQDMYGKRLTLDEIQLLQGELINLYRLLAIEYPTGMLAYVIDTFNTYNFANKIVPLLKDVILRREGKFILRPDSGVPEEVVLGLDKTVLAYIDSLPNGSLYRNCDISYYKDDKGESHQLVKTEITYNVNDYVKGIIKSLADTFGTTTNSKGYQELPPQIGLVYGDGINYEAMSKIYQGLEAKGYAVNCICMAMGAWVLSGSIARDSLGFAIKASQTKIGDIYQPVYKQPIADSFKKSPSGFLSVTDIAGRIMCIPNVTEYQEKGGMLRTILLDGKFSNQHTYDELREEIKALI